VLKGGGFSKKNLKNHHKKDRRDPGKLNYLEKKGSRGDGQKKKRPKEGAKKEKGKPEKNGKKMGGLREKGKERRGEGRGGEGV